MSIGSTVEGNENTMIPCHKPNLPNSAKDRLTHVGMMIGENSLNHQLSQCRQESLRLVVKLYRE